MENAGELFSNRIELENNFIRSSCAEVQKLTTYASSRILGGV